MNRFRSWLGRPTPAIVIGIVCVAVAVWVAVGRHAGLRRAAAPTAQQPPVEASASRSRVAASTAAPRRPDEPTVAALGASAPGGDRACETMTSPVANESDTAANERRDEALRTTMQAVAERLRSTPGDRAHAVGLLFEQRLAIAAAFRANDPHRCAENDAVCSREWAMRVDAETLARVAPAIDALVRMASTTADPFIYASAIEACSSFASARPPDACALVAPEQWARLDPGNAVPWLRIAAQAQGRGDTNAVDDALRHVGAARSGSLYGDRVPSIVDGAMPPSASDADRGDAGFMAALLVGMWTLPDYRTLTDHCSAAAVLDSNRRQTCDAATAALLEHPSSLLESRLAIRLAERIGWPRERLDTLAEERDAIQAVLSQEVHRLSALSPCERETARRMQALRVAEVGEVAMAKAALTASGRSRLELAEAWRAERRAAAVAASAAQAAAAASEAR